MARRTALRAILPAGVVALFGVFSLAEGWIRPREARSQTARPAASPSAVDEKAIRAVDDAFVREYNRGESKALAALFTDDAESIEAEGDRFQGAS